MTLAKPLKRHSLEWAAGLFAAVFSAVSWRERRDLRWRFR